MHEEGVARLVAETVAHRYSRRDVLRRAAALGLAAPAVAIALDARAAMAQSPENSNPLGVDPAAPLDVVIFKGGYGDDYAIYVNDNMYARDFPEAEITYAGIQRLGEQLQPRFIAGEPPDVIDNSGAGNLDTAVLVSEGQLAELDDLLAAPSYDSEGMTFGETLIPGSQDTGVFNAKQMYLNYVVSVTGLWYSSSLFEANGWTYPQTWTEMLDLCAEIKAAGTTPWMTTGVYPQYMQGMVFNQLVWKQNPQAIVDIDNLEEGAWGSDAVRAALEAVYALYENEYIGQGWEGLTHTESQAEWLQGNGVFLPCGSWLENEMSGGLIPEGFDMVVAPIPSLDGDTQPFETISWGAGEVFIVPAEGKNVAGGKEWLRMLFSKEGGRSFSELTKSLSVVQGSADGLELGTAFASSQQAIEASGENQVLARFGGWYPDLQEIAKNSMGELLQGVISIDEFIESVQEVADTVKDDESIPKYERTLEG
ncbi:MAG: N-acetylglucosamine/diacetylchitobiose ABC transporter substrate-binding protein [Thermomicrobiales bacterium]